MDQGKTSRVKVESVLSIVSSKPIGPGKVQKLTSLDHAMGLHTIHVVFYYKSNPFSNGLMMSDFDNLRMSLSDVLTEYPRTTGRLTRSEDGNWEVKCNDAGVRMLRAVVNSTLDEWLRSADASEERDLTVWEEMPDDPSIWSPFRIQLNNFKCGGLAIGLSCTHLEADFTSATQLIKAWTQLHRGEPLSHPSTFIPPPSTSTRKIYTEATQFYAANKSAHSAKSAKMRTATLRFSDSSIKKRLALIQNKCPNATPFDLLAALFWSRIAGFKIPSDDQNHSLSICVDLRKHGNETIPYEYFGNAVHFSVLSLNAHELMDSNRLGNVSERIHQHVAGIEDDQFWSIMDWLDKQREEGGKFGAPSRMYGPLLTCINMEHMMDTKNGIDAYGCAAFKKGERPDHVSYHVGNVDGEGLIIIMPSPEGGLGRTVTVVLPEEQIVGMLEDKAVMNLEPVLVTGGERSPSST